MLAQAAGSSANVCLQSLSLLSSDVGGGCTTSYFQIGFVNDADWCVHPQKRGEPGAAGLTRPH